uniref:SGNH domain-containing protein n=1 Tax=Chaetoceros debilis TaxID=122233 RepID=A0A7S3VER1_9STRA
MILTSCSSLRRRGGASSWGLLLVLATATCVALLFSFSFAATMSKELKQSDNIPHENQIVKNHVVEDKMEQQQPVALSPVASSDVAKKQQHQEMNATPNKMKNFCTRSDIRHGKWVGKINSTNSSTETAVMPMHAPNLAGANSSQNYDACNAPDMYQWQVANEKNENDSSCEFQQEFNSELFCDRMKNTVILFIGDSITWEMYESLVHLTDGHVDKRVHNRAIQRKIAIVINVCGDNHVTLIYRWNKDLSNKGTSVAIENMLNETFPTMIVLNTGAHYQSDIVYHERMDHALDLIAGWQSMCQDRNLPCPFFWRTTPPGIFNCKSFTRPVNNITMMEEHVASNPGAYNWNHFRHQNELALQKLESSGLSSYNIIDAYEVGIQRPELQVSQADCLHHCQPAAADAYNTIMLHYLQVNRTLEDMSKIAKYEYSYNRTTNIALSGIDVDWSQDTTPYLS